MKKFNQIFTLFLLAPGAFSFAQPGQLDPSTRLRLASEFENSLKDKVLNIWYPRSVDQTDGGFLSTFTFDFKPVGPQDKMIVTQARHTWVNARAAIRYPKQSEYLSNARHGFLFLKEHMWDPLNGGFFTLVNKKGIPAGDSIKTAYGNAFGLYALSAYYEASKDPAALQLLKECFGWLEKHSHDPVYKGYYQHLGPDGKPIKRPAGTPSTSDLGYKDQNSSIHLLEALTECYRVWPDPLVWERLKEMLLLIRDRITTGKGYLILFFHPDWTPVSFQDSSREVILRHVQLDHVSFGHDVETAYLMLEASHALGWEKDSVTEKIAKRMVDHALQNGWDYRLGGFYDQGYYFRNPSTIEILRDSKNWWSQAEGLNTLLLMNDKYPDDTHRYGEKFLKMWSYISTYLIDPVYGDWYEEGIDRNPETKKSNKGHIWKSTYHHYRSLVNCVDRLRSGETD